MTRSRRSKQSLTAQCTANRQTIVKCQASITSFCGRATLKKKTPGSLHWQSYTFGSWLAPFIRSIRKSEQRPLHPRTSLHQWPGQQFQNSQNESVAVQAKESISETKSRAPSGGALRGPRRATVPFMAPDLDVVLKLLIQRPRSYPQLINQHQVFLYRFSS